MGREKERLVAKMIIHKSITNGKAPLRYATRLSRRFKSRDMSDTR